MSEQQGTVTIYNSTTINTNTNTNKKKSSFSMKVGLTQMLRGGAIFEVTNLDQAKIAESSGACSIIISDPIHQNSISRMSDPSLIKEIKQSVSIPVMARSRIGHFVEAQILESINVDYIDESEILGVADEENFINKHKFRVPFVNGCRDLGEALRRVREGASMVRIQGDFERSGDIVETVRNVRSVMKQIRVLTNMDDDEVFAFSKRIGAPYDILAQTKQMGRLPVVHFAAGGIVTPADAALMMQLGCDGVVVGCQVFEDCLDPYKRVGAIVQAVRHYNDPHVLAESCSELDDSMAGLNIGEDDGVELEEQFLN